MLSKINPPNPMSLFNYYIFTVPPLYGYVNIILLPYRHCTAMYYYYLRTNNNNLWNYIHPMYIYIIIVWRELPGTTFLQGFCITPLVVMVKIQPTIKGHCT